MKKISIIATLSTSFFIFHQNAIANNADDRYAYIGAVLGISEPVVKAFKYTSGTKTTKMCLKQSKMFGGKIGYSFYPNMMIEISGTHQPQYRLSYRLPSHVINQYLSIPETYDITKVSSNVLTLNFIYEFEKKWSDIKTYAILGAGITQISIKPKSTAWYPPSFAGFGNEIEYFKVKKNNQNCFAWQFGGGFAKELTDNFIIDISAKLQVVNDIKIKYDILDLNTLSYISQTPIKKTIGVGEFALGLTYKLPFRKQN